MATSNNGPDYMVSKNEGSVKPWGNRPITQLKHWSDVVYLTWMHITAGDAQVQRALRWIDRQTLRGAELDVIVETVARKKGLRRHRARKKALKWDVPVWPGILISAGDDAFNAVLGTPDGRGVAWLLAQ